MKLVTTKYPMKDDNSDWEYFWCKIEDLKEVKKELQNETKNSTIKKD